MPADLTKEIARARLLELKNERPVEMVRLSKKLAGRILEGTTWDGVPRTPSLMAKVDISNYPGREQAYVKHSLLERYLPDWGYKVGSKWDSLVYVDAPWQTKHPNYADSSFGVAV